MDDYYSPPVKAKRHLKAGDVWMAAEAFEEAFKFYNSALGNYEKAGDIEGQRLALTKMMAAAKASGDRRMAENCKKWLKELKGDMMAVNPVEYVVDLVRTVNQEIPTLSQEEGFALIVKKLDQLVECHECGEITNAGHAVKTSPTKWTFSCPNCGARWPELRLE